MFTSEENEMRNLRQRHINRNNQHLHEKIEAALWRYQQQASKMKISRRSRREMSGEKHRNLRNERRSGVIKAPKSEEKIKIGSS